MVPAPRFTPLTLALSYAVLGATWIVASDVVVAWWIPESDLLAYVASAKGLLFIAITSSVLYVWARRFHRDTTAKSLAFDDSEERYRLLAQNSHDVIWIMSPEGALQYVSPSVERLLGLAPERVIAGGLPGVLAPESLERALTELATARTELNTTGHLRPRILELEQVHADGTHVWTEVNATEFQDRQGRVTGILGVTRDITARRAAQIALAGEVARWRALLDVSIDAIHVLDVDGRLLEASDVFLRERGLTREMIPRLNVASWDVGLEEEAVRAKLSVGPEPMSFETTHRRADGSAFPVEIRAKRVEIGGQAVIYATARDITQRRDMEQRLLRSQRLESVGLIASGIAHDLNNVLTPILLSTGMLELRYDSPADKAVLKPIEAAARRGSNIVQQILTFARGAEGQRVTVEPRLLLKELAGLIRETFPRNISHQLTIAADAWPVSGDPTQLHQVLLNLAVNARDAMPQGGTLTLTVTNRRVTVDQLAAAPSCKPGDYVCIAVADTGTGMTPEVIDHLFEPFFTTKPRGRGTGLGLSTVHGLVRAHGGFVEVDSTLGRGSVFRVFLPAAVVTVQPAAIAAPPAKTLLGRGEHVLVADDEPAILSVLASVLAHQGFVVLTATDGDEALQLFERHQAQIAVVLTDVMMPKFDGVRLATEVRRRAPAMPVIAMSGMIAPTVEDDNRIQLRELGVTTILDKPYAEADLLRAIRQVLQR